MNTLSILRGAPGGENVCPGSTANASEYLPLPGPFWVGHPSYSRRLVAGAAMSWARAVGEFGATLLFAGNLTGRTQTMPLAVYTAMESDLRAAQSLSLILVAAALFVLLLVRRLAPALAVLPYGEARRA